MDVPFRTLAAGEPRQTARVLARFRKRVTQCCGGIRTQDRPIAAGKDRNRKRDILPPGQRHAGRCAQEIDAASLHVTQAVSNVTGTHSTLRPGSASSSLT